MEKEKWHYVLYSLDTIKWVLLTTKVLHVNDYPTDWHIDEVFPWYSIILRGEETLDEMLDYITKEYYTFQPWERECYKEKIEFYLNQGIEDLIIDWPLDFLFHTDRVLDQSDIEYYSNRANLTKEEFLLKIEEWKKNKVEYVEFKTINRWWVKPFNRDKVIKSLNWELFWLKKLEYIQDCIAKGIRRY
jgi:hypothetical protein